MAHVFYLSSLLTFVLVGLVALVWPPVLWCLVVVVPLFLLGVFDSMQWRRAVLRNFPVIGHLRFLLEAIRPEIYQYFIESNTDGTPFNREMRALAYQRAKRVRQTMPFGTQRDVYALGYQWMNHSLTARPPLKEEPRIAIGGKQCAQPYQASLLNISAMSFGALSRAAILALNGGARDGGFYHNTGEGGLSPYHLEPGGDVVWQIGTGYFGCRTPEGNFNEEAFIAGARHESVKMIEVKLSQGAKPGHGGILPAAKVTSEIAAIRHVAMGQDVISPPVHSAFDSPRGLLEFVAHLRELSGGKPVGFKLCVGSPVEFLCIGLAMKATGLLPDFITVDGGEGGTGAAPVEFSNSVGMPLFDGLVFVNNVLKGLGLRDEIRLIASGKVVSGFHMLACLAAGADLCNAARAFMLSLGCIQARRCDSNKCPVGVATQNPHLIRGLDPNGKRRRVASFHEETVHAFLELLGAAGLDHPCQVAPWHVHRRISETEVQSFAEIYRHLEPGALLHEPLEEPWKTYMAAASAEAFQRRVGPAPRGSAICG